MRTRRLLETTSLNDFKAFCEKQGWKAQRPVGTIEVLRMSHPRRETLTVGTVMNSGYSGRMPRHPLYDEAARMYDDWQQSTREMAA